MSRLKSETVNYTLISVLFPGRETYLTLTLLMARIRANDPHDALAAHNLTMAADLLYRCQNLHIASP